MTYLLNASCSTPADTEAQNCVPIPIKEFSAFDDTFEYSCLPARSLVLYAEYLLDTRCECLLSISTLKDDILSVVFFSSTGSC